MNVDRYRPKELKQMRLYTVTYLHVHNAWLKLYIYIHKSSTSLAKMISIILCTCTLINPFPTIGNSLKKQKSLYKVLTPSIKPPIIIINILTRKVSVCVCVCESVTDVTSLPQRVLWERGYNVYRNAYAGNESPNSRHW